MSRVVIILELTCGAEENFRDAQLRKETKYAELVSEIQETKVWKVHFFTIEVGARGLVGFSTHRALTKIGLASSNANGVCKTLSWVAARCSCAIFGAHRNLAWSQSNLLVAPALGGRSAGIPAPPEHKNNVQVMKAHGVTRFFHFTDVSNLESIKKHGLVPWVSLSSEVKSVNSSVASRNLDAEKGLSNFVRLSFCKRSPMMFVALKDRRMSDQ
jgi:hypothetical protein